MNEERKWHVVFTRKGFERKVTASLSKTKIESYCPIHAVHPSNKSRFHWCGTQSALQPLFTSYVFVLVNEREYLKVIQANGVLNFLYWLGRPAIITREEIDAIKNYANENYQLSLEKIPVNPYAGVRISEGRLIQRDGNVLFIQGSCTKITLSSIGYVISATTQRNIEVLNENAKRKYFWQLAG